MIEQNHTPLREFMRRIAGEQEKQGHGDLSVHGYVLRNGRSFRSEPLTPEEQRHIDRCGWQAHRAKQCYHNAQTTALAMPSQDGMTLRYAEGFVGLGMSCGINHAWLSLNGKVVDTTIRIDRTAGRRRVNSRNRPMGLIPEGWEYYGVELDPMECLHSMDHHMDGIGPLIDDWRCGWPLLVREMEARVREEK